MKRPTVSATAMPILEHTVRHAGTDEADLDHDSEADCSAQCIAEASW